MPLVPTFLRLLCVSAALVSERPDCWSQQTDPPPSLSLSVLPGKPSEFRLSSTEQEKTVLILEGSADLISWAEAGRFHDAVRAFPLAAVAAVADGGPRFYRAHVAARTVGDDWKNQLVFPDEEFRAAGNYDTPRWVKFAIVLGDEERVHFQDSTKYPFHYEFATARLPGFQGLNRAAFDAVTLRRQGQQAVLGAVIFPPRQNLAEYGVQFVGLDAYEPEEIARWLAAVRAAIHAPAGIGAVYMPVFEQWPSVRQCGEEYAARGIETASLDRWTQASHIYANGWALGTLKFFPAMEIDAAFADGRLLPQDVLLTDGVPAETPLVAGLISLSPSTPNSHTAILAKSFGIPFVYFPSAEEQTRLRGLAGRQVVLRAYDLYGQGVVSVIDAHGQLSPAMEAEMRALKQARPIDYAAKQPLGAVAVPAAALTPDDIRYVGGKAANYGLLRRTVPDHCPDAIALSFDLWDAFLSQKLPGGAVLKDEITARLAPHQSYPPHMASLKTALAGIRGLFTQSADFSSAQRQEILDALAGFTPERKIRFRSSTNVEDSETFTGAGLYDSHSGCVLDDLDEDAAGPSACDASEANERGVFRAIRKVYASFYNDNAYLERLRRGVDENKVGMGVLVHHSFPDEEEQANGVAVMKFQYSFNSSYSGQMVSQLGAEPVANPTGGSLPEIVEIYGFDNTADYTLRQHSSRLPLGAAVMKWQDDYQGMLSLFRAVAQDWKEQRPDKTSFTLDFEYKKDARLGLVVKQVRALPADTDNTPVTAFWLDDAAEWVVAQKEAGDVFANHRLKSKWRLEAAPMKMTQENLAGGMYAGGRLDYMENGARTSLSGALSTWPNASLDASGATQRWTTGAGARQWSWALSTTALSSVPASRPPIVTPGDCEVSATVAYATPVPTIDYTGKFIMTNSDYVVLEPRRVLEPGCPRIVRDLEGKGGLRVRTVFYWPNEAPGAGGYTAPLVQFEETTITGLVSSPIVLRDYYSQTYRPGHHNFTEEFIFEPRLEPGLSAETLAELEAANIRFLYVEMGFSEPRMAILGLDGVLRNW